MSQVKLLKCIEDISANSVLPKMDAEFVVCTREEAKQRNNRHYFTGKTCKSGHIDLRFVKSGKCLSCSRVWRLNNPQSHKQSQKSYYDNNRQSELKRRKSWRVSNLDKGASYSASRRARKQNATPVWFEKKLIQDLYDSANYLTRLTGIQWDVDHEIPLSNSIVCGLHVYNNLQLLPRTANLIKWCKFQTN